MTSAPSHPVGLAQLVTATPSVALALSYDIESVFEGSDTVLDRLSRDGFRLFSVEIAADRNPPEQPPAPGRQLF